MERRERPMCEIGNQSGKTPKGAAYFWDLSTGELITIPAGDVTAVRTGGHYLRIPGPLVLPLAPVLGGLYIIFLPLIGVALVTALVIRRLAKALSAGSRAVLLTISAPKWVPGRSHIAGWAGNHKGNTDGSQEATNISKRELEEILAELEKEISERRKQGGKEG